jgi:hypothetical protein
MAGNSLPDSAAIEHIQPVDLQQLPLKMTSTASGEQDEYRF